MRRLLTSRWVDVSLLQIGTTNGVVYLLGSFEPLVEDALQRLGLVQERDPAKRTLRLLLLVDRELRRLHGVRDVALNLSNVRRKGGNWHVRGTRGSGHTQGAQRDKAKRPEDDGGAVYTVPDEANDDEGTKPTPSAA